MRLLFPFEMNMLINTSFILNAILDLSCLTLGLIKIVYEYEFSHMCRNLALTNQ